MRFEIDDDSRVGRWKAGLICLPNGTLRWGDIATPSAATALRDAAVALAAAGQSVAVPPDEIFQDRQAVTPYRIVATVIAARLDICMPKWGAPQFGFGDKGVLKGKGALTIRWTIHSAESRSLIQSVEIAEPFDILPTGSGGLADAIRVGLSANAARFGRSHTLAIDGQPGR